MARLAAHRLSFVGYLLVAFLVGANSVQAKPLATESGSSNEMVALAALPQEGRQTYALIFQGGPFPYEKDGSVFGNRERRLPVHARGYYREYTVRSPGIRGRGGRRIACGGPPRNPEVCYYSDDHYASFRRIGR